MYTKALSSTLIILQDHPDMFGLNDGVAPTVARLSLAQRGEVFSLPLNRGARQAFFGTLLDQLKLGLGGSEGGDEEGRPEFLLVFKSIGQKVGLRELFGLGRMRQELGGTWYRRSDSNHRAALSEISTESSCSMSARLTGRCFFFHSNFSLHAAL